MIADVNLELKPGTLTALVGPNGAGKSTLLHLLQGRLNPTGGSVQCNGSIALMPQRASIDWSFPITVSEMVNLGKTSSTQKNEAPPTEAVLERLGIKEMGRRRLSQLSGGQQQRVLLARALMQHSDVLLLDEPCSAIDPPTREHLLDVMRQQASSGQTFSGKRPPGRAIACGRLSKRIPRNISDSFSRVAFGRCVADLGLIL